MEKIKCETCQSAKTTLRRGLCEAAACKSCAHLYDEEAFSYLPKIPDVLTKGVYCHGCFVEHVSALADDYDQSPEAARNIDVYFKGQGKETRLIQRPQVKYKIESCGDRDELILRFAFLAVRDGYSSLVDVDIIATKLRDGTFQTTNYHGTAVPAHARAELIPKDKSLRHNPN